MTESQNFRDNLRWFMAEFSVSQTAFSEATEIALPNLNRILMGHANPRIDTCERIAKACSKFSKVKVKVRWLLETTNEFQENFTEILETVT